MANLNDSVEAKDKHDASAVINNFIEKWIQIYMYTSYLINNFSPF